MCKVGSRVEVMAKSNAVNREGGDERELKTLR